MGVNYLGSTQFAFTLVPSAEFGITEGLSRLEVSLFFGDFTWRLRGEGGWKGQVDTGGRSFKVITLRGIER